MGAGWADGASKEKIEAWAKKGLELRDEVDKVVQETSAVEYGRLLRKVRLPSGSFMLLGPRLMWI